MHKLLVVSGLCGLCLCGSAGLAAAQAPSIDDLINLKRVGALAISPDGRRVAFTIRETNWDENAYETELWLADVASGPPRQLTNAKRSSSTDYPDVYVAPVRTMTAKRISDTAAQIAAWPKHGRETVRWKSQDGAEIEGVLHKPADFQAGRRYPLLVVIHGGPTGVSRPVPYGSVGYYPIDAYLAKGALVLEPGRLHLGVSHHPPRRSLQGVVGRRRHFRLDDLLRSTPTSIRSRGST